MCYALLDICVNQMNERVRTVYFLFRGKVQRTDGLLAASVLNNLKEANDLKRTILVIYFSLGSRSSRRIYMDRSR